MDVTDRDIRNLERISEEVFGDSDYIEVVEVKDTSGDVMVEVKALGDGNIGTRNAFGGSRLETYHENGYVAVAVGGDNESHSAWFERADTIEFGEPGPAGEFDLKGDWSAVVREVGGLVLKRDSQTVGFVRGDGWDLEHDALYHNFPAHITDRLEEYGFNRVEDVEFEF